MSTITPPDLHSPSSLLSLPPELRNTVYRYVLDPHRKSNWSEHTYVNAAGQEHQPAVLRTCTQIRSEMLPMWYASTTFCVEVYSNGLADGPLTWLSRVKEEHLKLVHRIWLDRRQSDSDVKILSSTPRSATSRYTDRIRSHMFWRDYDEVLKCSLLHKISLICGPIAADVPWTEYWVPWRCDVDRPREMTLVKTKIKATQYSLENRLNGGNGSLDGYRYTSNTTWRHRIARRPWRDRQPRYRPTRLPQGWKPQDVCR